MSGYLKQFEQLDWDGLSLDVYSRSGRQVELSLIKSGNGIRLTFDDFKTLVSPAAFAYLPIMISQSQLLTKQRFGHTISMYIPLYLSNLCANDCTYCGFSMSNHIKRKTLNKDEVVAELKVIKQKGYDSILLVTGEHQSKVGMDYFREMVPIVKKYFSYVALEIQPLNQFEYAELKSLGIDSVLVYQETYQPRTYAQHHLKGNKTDFLYRLDTADRLGKASIDKIGIGALLGLEEWRIDSVFAAHHLEYLQSRYWRSRFSVSFPRLRPCEGGIKPKSLISDQQLIQLICAYRLCFPEVELSLSTRESAELRDLLVLCGITHMSAESSTQPGGYVNHHSELEQFSISDDRTTEEVTSMLIKKNIDVIWHDWSRGFSS